jgi:hypothetical protein
MRLRLFLQIHFFALACAWGVGSAQGQVNYFFVPTGTATWNSDANWLDPNLQNSFVPDGGLGESATVDSGGVAEVIGLVPSPGALSIGSTRTAAPPTVNGGGTVRVTDTGQMTVNGSNTTNAINVGVAGSGTLEVLPGGSLSTPNGSLGSGPDASDIIIVGNSGAISPKANLSATGAALNGVTRVYPNANFTTTGNTVFGSTGVYTSEVNATGSGFINVGGTAVLDGTARLNFIGVTPTVGGPSFKILEANAIAGTSFDAITSNAVTPFNQVFVGSTVNIAGNRKEMRVSLQESIVLEVNRDSGLVRMTHPGSGGIAFDSYTISSAAGSLVAGNLSGLDDNNLFGGNWLETTATANSIAELKPNGDASYTPGTPTPLGNVFNPLAGAFGGASEEDLQFRFSRFSDGALIPAVVKYSGTKVNNLLLQVDPTGVEDSYLRNTSNTSVQIDAYDVRSAAGRLSPAQWESLDDNNVGGANVWVEGLNNTANLVSEFNQSITTPTLTLAPGAIHNLGRLYLGGTQDLSFQFLLAGEQAASTGAVIYEAFVESMGVQGDYNENGVVDAADYTLWRNNLNGAPTALKNRNPANSANNINQADYTFWKQRFGATSGSGSIIISQVPEPATWMLAMMLAVVIGCVKRSAR